MKKNPNGSININKNGTRNGYLPSSLKFISSCLRTVSSNVRSAGVSVAGSISGDFSSSDDQLKDQVLWACFDRLEFGSSSVKQVLLIGYSDGFQVLDVEDASNVCELVSRRDDPVTFLQIQPIPEKSDDNEGFMTSHPMLLVVASGTNTSNSSPTQNGKDGLVRDGFIEPRSGNLVNSPTTVRFYSLVSHNYVHTLRFRSTVYMVRCSPRIVAVGLAGQIYCFDALTLETKFSVLTYPVPQLGGQGFTGVNIGYGPMAVGPRWLAYASNNPLLSNSGRLSPQSLSPGISPSTSPSNGNLMARYAMESSKNLAAGLVNGSWKNGRVSPHSLDMDSAGMVVIKDFMSRAIVSQFRAHSSPISALCFDPSATLLVTASIHGNNINIFRIIPSVSQNGPGSHSYDWNASHVHLYKLHRGITSAVIQDICFSSYSQWIAIVSSRGTTHVFVLSPFGGETGLQLVNTNGDGSTLLPVLTKPWWCTNQHSSSSPPGTVTLTVVSRIKNGGWLSTVSNAASSATGKTVVPSGVSAAVFHSSLHKNTPLNSNALEHLLVYSSSGHLIQYELVPLLGGEQGQDEESRVKIDSVQWWDVCRRSDWPEKEEILVEKENVKQPLDRSHFYISNAEVQLRSGRVPIWQKSKIHFYTVDGRECEEMKLIGGEVEVEKIGVCEVDMRRKDLLPVIDHFQRKNIDGRCNGCCSSDKSVGKLEDSVECESDGVNMLCYVEESYAVNTPSLGGLKYIINECDGDEGKLHEDMHHPVGFGGRDFQEGYCKASSNGELTDSKKENDDDMFGGIFAFSEAVEEEGSLTSS